VATIVTNEQGDNVPSLETITATLVFHQVLDQLETRDLYKELGRDRMCALLRYMISTVHGRNALLTCNSVTGDCNVYWSGLEDLQSVEYKLSASYKHKSLTIRHHLLPVIHIVASWYEYSDNGIILSYSTKDQGARIAIRSQTHLLTMYAVFKKATVTDEEIQCLMLPLSAFVARIRQDYPR